MNTVTFEITKDKTLVSVVGLSGIEVLDITNTEIEKQFVKLLKKLRDYRDQNQILEAIDINKWQS